MSAPTSPIIAKSVQKEITAEAKREQKAFQHMVKDLEHLEKKDNKAHKHVDKMAKALNKNEQKEQKTMQKMHKATEIHEDTKLKTTHLHRELQVSEHPVNMVSVAQLQIGFETRGGQNSLATKGEEARG
ncbi:hypothetical protein CC2G_010376 [Coprinopsis cinerea AmutBmut pab1-1]|nr:hypothetical protein CC2G_010376 [Coprinopsis cinerea AmutBmut pab1-1]